MAKAYVEKYLITNQDTEENQWYVIHEYTNNIIAYINQ